MNEYQASCNTSSAYLEQVFRVNSVNGRRALVEGNRLTACQSCKESSSCGTGLIASYKQKPLCFWLENDLGAKTGDFVVVGTKASTMVLSALFAYLVPALLMVSTVAISAAAGASDLQSLIWAIIALFIGFSITQIFSHFCGHRFGSVEMLRITNSGASLYASVNHQNREVDYE